MDFEVSLQKFRFGPVSMVVHRGYSCNDLMLLAALKLESDFLIEYLQFKLQRQAKAKATAFVE